MLAHKRRFPAAPQTPPVSFMAPVREGFSPSKSLSRVKLKDSFNPIGACALRQLRQVDPEKIWKSAPI